jgi:o-succinylbenzoate synthase
MCTAFCILEVKIPAGKGSMVKISNVEVGSINVPLSHPSKFALGLRRETENVITRISTDEGIVGLGEASPFSPFCHETKASMIYLIKEMLSQSLRSYDLCQISEIMEALDSVAVDNRFAKSTIDMSLYDLLGKKLQIPVYALLGGKCKDSIPIAMPISMGKLDEMTQEACKQVEGGVTALKVYVGMDVEEDVDRIKAIREAVGPNVQIKIDVNQRWSPKIAIKTIKRMEKYDLLLVEQPVPKWDLDGLKTVRTSVDTPIAVDESLCSPQDAMEIIKREAADVFNVYATKNGGLYRAKSILNIAEASGVPCLIGSLYELSIGTAAGVHLACSSNIVKYPCDLIGPVLHTHDIVDEPITIKDGHVHVPTSPGLGIGDIDQSVTIHWS